ncbi:hypothetical protein B0H17DRAFT_1206224 [Mycena rosella]|uniref:Uncharacterized protein n=1 Tax=Mycena rosella TaxID=1033263 RepID=A0AAD7D6W3_MYCRO|nr:hypothetical protein B0H17DRAFT_1206224 [Mycena rosella]
MREMITPLAHAIVLEESDNIIKDRSIQIDLKDLTMARMRELLQPGVLADKYLGLAPFLYNELPGFSAAPNRYRKEKEHKEERQNTEESESSSDSPSVPELDENSIDPDWDDDPDIEYKHSCFCAESCNQFAPAIAGTILQNFGNYVADSGCRGSSCASTNRNSIIHATNVALIAINVVDPVAEDLAAKLSMGSHHAAATVEDIMPTNEDDLHMELSFRALIAELIAVERGIKCRGRGRMIATRGVSGRGFPFYFWSLAWGTGLGFGANTAYLHSDGIAARRRANHLRLPVQQHRHDLPLVADSDTTADLIADVAANCSAFLVPISSPAPAPAPFNASALLVQHEQVVHYYRASSVALSLDGYNNSAVFAPENATADRPLPAPIDANLLECLNVTIGPAVPN